MSVQKCKENMTPSLHKTCPENCQEQTRYILHVYFNLDLGAKSF